MAKTIINYKMASDLDPGNNRAKQMIDRLEKKNRSSKNLLN